MNAQELKLELVESQYEEFCILEPNYLLLRLKYESKFIADVRISFGSDDFRTTVVVESCIDSFLEFPFYLSPEQIIAIVTITLHTYLREGDEFYDEIFDEVDSVVAINPFQL